MKLVPNFNADFMLALDSGKSAFCQLASSLYSYNGQKTLSNWKEFYPKKFKIYRLLFASDLVLSFL